MKERKERKQNLKQNYAVEIKMTTQRLDLRFNRAKSQCFSGIHSIGC